VEWADTFVLVRLTNTSPKSIVVPTEVGGSTLETNTFRTCSLGVAGGETSRISFNRALDSWRHLASRRRGARVWSG